MPITSERNYVERINVIHVSTFKIKMELRTIMLHCILNVCMWLFFFEGYSNRTRFIYLTVSLA